jgi:hypothetical protein
MTEIANNGLPHTINEFTRIQQAGAALTPINR